MLCDSCQHQNTCFLPKLAARNAYNDSLGDRWNPPKTDEQIQVLLNKLQVCELYVPRFPQGLSWVNGMNQLRAWGYLGLTRVAAWVRRLLKGHCVAEN